MAPFEGPIWVIDGILKHPIRVILAVALLAGGVYGGAFLKRRGELDAEVQARTGAPVESSDSRVRTQLQSLPKDGPVVPATSSARAQPEPSGGSKRGQEGPTTSKTPVPSATALSRPARSPESPPQTADPTKPADAAPAPELDLDLNEVGGFAFKFKRCARQGTSSVECDFEATNLKQDRVLRLYNARTSIVDSRGFEQRSTSTRIGSHRKNGKWSAAESSALTNVPVDMSAKFGGVEPGVRQIARIVLGLEWVLGTTVERGTVEFRELPLR